MPTIDEALARARQVLSAGNVAEAEQLCRQILHADAAQADAWYLLGLSQHVQQRLTEAEGSYHKALHAQPDHADAANYLGIALAQQGKLEAAVGAYHDALRCRPDDADVYNNLGIALTALGQIEEAIAALERAIASRPNFVEALNSLGAARATRQPSEQAVAPLREALRLRPNYLEAHSNLAAALTDLGQLDEALAHCEAALRLHPEHVPTHKHRARIWLLQGDFERGWTEYEWRWRLSPPPWTQPWWDGAPLAGRTILLHAEQGKGDTLQFIRYAPLVKARGGTVLVQVPAALVPLLSRSPGIDRLLAEGDALPHFDAHAPLMSLPRLLGTTFATTPANVPYLFADPALVEMWRPRLAFPDFTIGIAWQGNPQNRGDLGRSIPLRHFAPLAALKGVRLVSLQKGPGEEQLVEFRATWPVLNPGPRDEAGAFTDTAALMKNLDLVITSDTSIPHLAGGLGVPVWLALPVVPDWRWLLHREDSPWYPTMRLFRQTRAGDWNEVFARILAEASTLPSPR